MSIDARTYTTDTNSVVITATAGGASADLIYTCPPNHDATIDFFHVSNGSNATTNVTIQWYHADTNTYNNLVNAKAVSGHDVYNVITSDRIHLHAGDKILAFNGSSSSVAVFTSVRQYYNPTR
tara:strand:- start:179 stop:547 length:369 start_codon:yes stop_codon:yes gene_type:complete